MARAQPARKVPRIGVLFLASSKATEASRLAMRSAMQDLGYVEGRTIEIEYRSADGRVEKLPELAAQLVALKVDAIVTGGGNPSALAASKATTSIPIVMTSSIDAVETGLVESLARPGRNITGLTAPSAIALKQVELLRELVPGLARVAVLTRPNPQSAQRREQAKAMAQEYLKVALDFVDVAEPEELAPALAKVRASKPSALLVAPDPLFFQQQDPLLAFARSAKIPAIYPIRDFVDAGGLLSFSVSNVEVYRTAARFVDRILKGAKPADLPVEEPREYELVINLKTAKAMGLSIPQSFLVRANEVIQ